MTTLTPDKPKAKKFERLADPPNFKLIPLRLQVNAEICRRPLLRMDQLFELFPHVPQRTIYQIVYLLFHNGFIARPDQQKDLHPLKGSEKMYLSAEALGIDLHHAFFADPVPVSRFIQDSTYTSFKRMEHKHNETKALLNYERNARALGDFTFRNGAQIWTEVVPKKNRNQPAYDIKTDTNIMAHSFIANPPETIGKPQPKVPLALKSRFDWGIHLPTLIEDTGDDMSEPTRYYDNDLTTVTLPTLVEPDGLFSHAKTVEDFFFHESNEESETILPGEFIRCSPKAFNNNSLFAKYVGYIAYFRKWLHLKQLGITSFSVITETKTPGHLASIIDKLAPIFLEKPFNIHPEFLKFYDREMFARCDNNPYHPNFRCTTLAGQEVPVLPR